MILAYILIGLGIGIAAAYECDQNAPPEIRRWFAVYGIACGALWPAVVAMVLFGRLIE